MQIIFEIFNKKTGAKNIREQVNAENICSFV